MNFTLSKVVLAVTATVSENSVTAHLRIHG